VRQHLICKEAKSNIASHLRITELKNLATQHKVCVSARDGALELRIFPSSARHGMREMLAQALALPLSRRKHETGLIIPVTTRNCLFIEAQTVSRVSSGAEYGTHE